MKNGPKREWTKYVWVCAYVGGDVVATITTSTFVTIRLRQPKQQNQQWQQHRHTNNGVRAMEEFCILRKLFVFSTRHGAATSAAAKDEENMLLKRAITLCILEKHSMMVCYRFAGCARVSSLCLSFSFSSHVRERAHTHKHALFLRIRFHIHTHSLSKLSHSCHCCHSPSLLFYSSVRRVYTFICNSRAAARLCVHGSVFIHNK